MIERAVVLISVIKAGITPRKMEVIFVSGREEDQVPRYAWTIDGSDLS